jgi:hypothetical protein
VRHHSIQQNAITVCPEFYSLPREPKKHIFILYGVVYVCNTFLWLHYVRTWRIRFECGDCVQCLSACQEDCHQGQVIQLGQDQGESTKNYSDLYHFGYTRISSLPSYSPSYLKIMDEALNDLNNERQIVINKDFSNFLYSSLPCSI